MSLWSSGLPTPLRCRVSGCTYEALVDDIVCARHKKSDAARLAELSRDAIEAIATSMRSALIAQDYRSAANIAQKILDRTGFGPTSTVDVHATVKRDLSDMSTDELLAELGELTRSVLQLKPHTIDVTPLPDAMAQSPRGSVLSEKTDANVLANAPSVGDVPSPAPSSEPPPLVEPPAERCPFCRKSLADCAEMRTARPEVFEVLHADAPEFVERRRKYETDVMLKQINRYR